MYGKQTKFSFLVPLSWTADYLVAMIYIIIIFTHTEVDIVSIDKHSRLKMSKNKWYLLVVGCLED